MNQLGWMLTSKLASHSLIPVYDVFPETFSLILSYSVLWSFLETYCQALRGRFWIELSEDSISIRELWSPVALLIKFGDITEAQNQLGWTRFLSSSSPTSDVTPPCQPDLGTYHWGGVQVSWTGVQEQVLPVSWTPPGIVTAPPPWTVHSNV